MSHLSISHEKRKSLDLGFMAAFGAEPKHYFAVPGRTEIGGNHTDHQRGKVLAAAVDVDMRAAVRANGTELIRLVSDKFSRCEININQLVPVESEKNTAAALVRGMAAALELSGAVLQGFDIYCESDVLPGSGLSSSAAFEILLGRAMDQLFSGGILPAETIAGMGQWTEHSFFGKPCGLMDQLACALGGLVGIDFFNEDAPRLHRVNFDFAQSGHALCLVNTGSGHTELNHEYAAITEEMYAVASFFGRELLSQIDEAEFYENLPRLRKNCSDRAILRAMHYYSENRRVDGEIEALEKGDFESFLRLVNESGLSSWTLLQNVVPAGETAFQPVALALGLCRKLLGGRGASRVHGGGFAGTVQAFVPMDMLDEFTAGMEAVFGEGSCRAMKIV